MFEFEGDTLLIITINEQRAVQFGWRIVCRIFGLNIQRRRKYLREREILLSSLLPRFNADDAEENMK